MPITLQLPIIIKEKTTTDTALRFQCYFNVEAQLLVKSSRGEMLCQIEEHS